MTTVRPVPGGRGTGRAHPRTLGDATATDTDVDGYLSLARPRRGWARRPKTRRLLHRCWDSLFLSKKSFWKSSKFLFFSFFKFNFSNLSPLQRAYLPRDQLPPREI